MKPFDEGGKGSYCCPVEKSKHCCGPASYVVVAIATDLQSQRHLHLVPYLYIGLPSLYLPQNLPPLYQDNTCLLFLLYEAVVAQLEENKL
jgi:hypothetical protein